MSSAEDFLRRVSGRSSLSSTALFPMAVAVDFVPGGERITADNAVSLWKVQSRLIAKAAEADTRLNLCLRAMQPGSDYFVPSLSVLCELAFGRLTGCSSSSAKEWADAMILAYYTGVPHDQLHSNSEHEMLLAELPPLPDHEPVSTPLLLKNLYGQAQAASEPSAVASLTFRPRPCGYVFKRGDIAWNCRTCQTDPTCVICDACFRDSDHSGHEVYFHRTTPGGCCDCGDAEAWKVDGCCDLHRPSPTATANDKKDDPMEAVAMAVAGYEQGLESVRETGLPPRLLAALGVVIGAAVEALQEAVDGAGVGADPTQWRLRWADEACRIANGTVDNDRTSTASGLQRTPNDYLGAVETPAQTLPEGYRLQLRLHNDDVHTFEEVIDALHGNRNVRRQGDAMETQSLVPLRDSATDMTHRVDSDGQVTVKSYSTIPAAMSGYRRLKSCGLHCAVVSTAQLNLEQRAWSLVSWLKDVAASHPAAAALVVHALVQINDGDHSFAGVHVWHRARTIPVWAGATEQNAVESCRKRFQAFPPQLASSYVTREESELLHGIAVSVNPQGLEQVAGARSDFYSNVAYRLPSLRYRKSPHALWGTLPSLYSDPVPPVGKHPFLQLLTTGQFDPTMANSLTESVFVVDTDLRKQQEADRITTSVFPHKLPGLNLISGVGTVRGQDISAVRPPLPSPMDLRHLLGTCSFRAPLSPVLLLLLLDPYPTKQMRKAIHDLFLSLLTDSRFRSRFAGAIGIAYRPLSTLFCAGVGTEADTPLHFTVQIFTAGSLVRALGSMSATEQLVLSDKPGEVDAGGSSIGVFASPIAHTIVRCIHTNLLGATKEVNMILKNTSSGNDDDSQDDSHRMRNDSLLPALTYVAGEHALITPLPAAPDDGFLDSRSTRHKRLPHLLRDLEYVIETPGTATRLLLPRVFPVYQGPSLSSREEVLSFSSIYARMLRLAQGMDPQKRKISGGHVEYEQNRWLEAFGLSLNFSGTRDALAESPMSSGSAALVPISGEASYLPGVREATGNIIAALLREIKLWLYREGMLETGLLVSPAHGNMELAQAEALQRSTLHVSGAFDTSMDTGESGLSMGQSVNAVALACATGVKMTESQLSLIENALKADAAEKQHEASTRGGGASRSASTGPVMGDWLRVPHSPLAGDSLSFHIPLHRALAKCVKSICAVVVPEAIRDSAPTSWWKIPVMDGDNLVDKHHPLVPLIRSTLRSSNCRVVWTAGPECSSQEAQRRRARSRAVSANIAVAKILYSLADHPIRCIAAAQQIERHLWARNGSSVAGMAMNYSSTPLCRSFRDLDILLVQLSAAGMSCGLGARRVFSLLQSRFSMDGYLCDPERRIQGSSTGASAYAPGVSMWINPPRLQDPDHAVVLSESLFSTLCVVVSELPPPPPSSPEDDGAIRQTVRRELLHALAAEPRSHSEAMTAASGGMSRREETDGGAGTSGAIAFREVFTEVLREIAQQKGQRSSRATSGPLTFELKATCCDEYDPTFFHLRRQEHQHAMDVVARLRKQKFGDDKDAAERHCLPLVCPPPKAHPRFLPCRLLLHLPAMDAAIRRSLLFALTGGSWLPPSEPAAPDEPLDGTDTEMTGLAATMVASTQSGDVPVTTFARRMFHAQTSSSSSFGVSRRPSANDPAPFSREVVAASSVSFLEVLQLLTLQVHTLEECASLHRTLPDLDDESRTLSAGLSINSYLRRLVWVPESLNDVWALKPYPDGPLTSKGSGERRGSILGFLIALYEHRSDHASLLDSDGGENADDGHGGARALATSGLKWLLRFVNALVEGASSVGAATKSATTGIPIHGSSGGPPSAIDLSSPSWTIDDDVRSTIRGMVDGLPDLWPKERETPSPGKESNAKSKEARKAAQMRVLENMRKKQAAFAATIATGDEPSAGGDETDSEQDLCIICRCDDTDGENNGPLGYLGHVQRSRVSQMRASVEAANREGPRQKLFQSFRVVGHMGCQLRETEAMDSKALTCLPKGSVVTVLKTKVSTEYDVLSRRVLVRHTVKDSNGDERVTEGWASVQSSQGYVILSPLSTTCYTNSAWGGTRPIVKQCGHAAHLKCVETHTLSLHQRAESEQPYDGRFAANIADGEFLCPLCKQLSNILIPRDIGSRAKYPGSMDIEGGGPTTTTSGIRPSWILMAGTRLYAADASNSGMNRTALEGFGSHLYNAMSVPWDRASGPRKKLQQQWHPAIHKWDYEENEDDSNLSPEAQPIKGVLRLMRQQLIAWAAVGHSAAASEAGARAIEEVLPFGVLSQTTDPWPEYGKDSKYTHSMLLELKRTMTGASGLLEVLCLELKATLSSKDPTTKDISIVGACLADILEGYSWVLRAKSSQTRTASNAIALWSELTGLISAMPCHVSKDGILPHRCEARATSAAMWTLKGFGSAEVNASDEPPAPMPVSRLLEAGLPAIPRNWGSMDPFVESSSVKSPDKVLREPFRPAVASSFLYKPLLVWDLNTFAGAIFSTLLTNDIADLPTSEELLHLAQTLVVARMIQAIVTPYGFEEPDEMDVDDDEFWAQQDVKKEGTALAKLVGHCRAMEKNRCLDLGAGLTEECNSNPITLFHGVGQAILPFSRSLILMLRACTAAIRDRTSKSAAVATKQTSEDEKLDAALCDQELMAGDDGFRILKALNGPLPSSLSSPWTERIDRWLVSAIGFELHHGSSGKTVLLSADVSSPRVAKSSQRLGKPAEEALAAIAHNDSNDSAEMEVDDMGEANVDPFMINNNNLMDDDDESDDDLLDSDEMDEAEELVDFTGQMMVGALFNAGSPTSTGTNDVMDSDDNSSSGTEGDPSDSDRRFAHVSRSPILPYQPSTLGLEDIGPGRQGAMIEYRAASAVMADLSHLGLIHKKEQPTFSLIRLPKSFVELYNVVNKVKGRDASNMDENEDSGSSETAICLLTGTVMRSGSSRRNFPSRSHRPPGACTMHARKHGSGIGIFFLLQKCTILLMHNNKSAYSPSIYVDEHGEEDPGLRRGRPLFLNEARYRALEGLWRQQGIPREVAQIRSTSDRVIRDNWY